jgi:hypothetical protein
MQMRPTLCILLVLLLSSHAVAFDRINLLFIGQVVPETCPLPYWFESEPAATFTLVPTKVHWSMSYNEARRQVRLYFPRTAELTWEYDFFMFINPYFEPFTASQIQNMYTAMTEGGSGGFQTLGGITIDSAEPNFAWLQSILASAFPNDPSAVELWRQTTAGRSAYRVILEKDKELPPVLTPFLEVGIEQVPGSDFYIVAMSPQQGATEWAKARGAFPKVSGREFPWLLSWKVGSGMTWSVADDLDVPWWSSIYMPSEQKYGLDILMNIILHSVGRSIPQDVILVNAVRRGLREYNEKTSTINAFIDFVEKLGANSNQILEDKLEVDALIEGSMARYLEGRYDEALAMSEEAYRGLAEFELRTMKLKDQALFWVYVTEWAVVSGTGLLSGYLVYILMLRKGLYRQVKVTRLTTDFD